MHFKLLLIITIISFYSCKENPSLKEPLKTTEKEVDLIQENTPTKAKETPDKNFKNYWYNGTAEINSYSLQQARYGELRDGNAVLIFVTEPFDPNKQVKADRPDKNTVSVLKLNSTKKFNTGVYPYSIMTSTFYPVNNNQHALKVTNSVQEWCGQVFMQLNNKNRFNIASYSYFESESDQQFRLPKNILENELFNQIRINPSSLPLGEHQVIPDFSYLRLSHKNTKAYACNISLSKKELQHEYTLTYPELNRTVTISYAPSFPYTILGWEEQFVTGYGKNEKVMTTKATLKKTLNIPYWAKNSNNDELLRNELMLD